MGSGGQSLALTTVREGVNRPDALGRLATWTVWLSFNPKTIYTRRSSRGGSRTLNQHRRLGLFFYTGAGTKKKDIFVPKRQPGGGSGWRTGPRRAPRAAAPSPSPSAPLRTTTTGGVDARGSETSRKHINTGEGNPIRSESTCVIVCARSVPGRGPCVPIVVRETGEGTGIHGSSPPSPLSGKFLTTDLREGTTPSWAKKITQKGHTPHTRIKITLRDPNEQKIQSPACKEGLGGPGGGKPDGLLLV